MGWLAMKDNEGIVGDEAWDLGGEFLDKLKDIYVDNFGRPPSKKEVFSIVDFCMADEFEEMYKVESKNNLYNDAEKYNKII